MLGVKAERVMQCVGGHSMARHCAGQSLWGCLVDKVALGQGFLQIPHFSSVSIIPPSSQYH